MIRKSIFGTLNREHHCVKQIKLSSADQGYQIKDTTLSLRMLEVSLLLNAYKGQVGFSDGNRVIPEVVAFKFCCVNKARGIGVQLLVRIAVSDSV